jgi:hypothetical protein
MARNNRKRRLMKQARSRVMKLKVPRLTGFRAMWARHVTHKPTKVTVQKVTLGKKVSNGKK